MSDKLLDHLRNSKGWPNLGNAAADRIEELESKLEKAVEALRFYADTEKWEDSRFVDEGLDEHGVRAVCVTMSTVMEDGGSIARIAIAELTGGRDE